MPCCWPICPVTTPVMWCCHGSSASAASWNGVHGWGQGSQYARLAALQQASMLMVPCVPVYKWLTTLRHAAGCCNTDWPCHFSALVCCACGTTCPAPLAKWSVIAALIGLLLIGGIPCHSDTVAGYASAQQSAVTSVLAACCCDCPCDLSVHVSPGLPFVTLAAGSTEA
jgi:hypothetical protein